MDLMCDWWNPSGAAFQPNARCTVSQGECACLKLPLQLHAVILTFSAGMESTLIPDIFLPCLKFADGNTVHYKIVSHVYIENHAVVCYILLHTYIAILCM